MKRAVFLLVIISMCLFLTVTSASAEELQVSTTQEVQLWNGVPESPAETPRLRTAARASTQSIEELLHEALLRGETEIDITRFQIPCDPNAGAGEDKAPELSAIMMSVIENYPDLFHVISEWGYSYTRSGNSYVVTKLYPRYNMTGKELEAAQELYDTELERILELMDDDWSDLEKILFINDYLASHYEYDLTYQIHDAYQFLRDGTGVCQSYYYVCKALLDACGIQSTYGRSDNEDHIWNVVRLDGKWYHLDVTWNDPTADILGKATHQFFLLSTGKLLALAPNRTDAVYGEVLSCTDTTYDTFYWQDVKAPFVQIGGKWYYSTDESVLMTDDVCKAGIVEIDHDIWHVPGNAGLYWPKAFSGLGAYRNWLIYNTDTSVMGYNPLSGQTRTFYTLTDNSRKIFGIEVTGNKVFCELDVHTVCDTRQYPNGRCPQNKEYEVSLTELDALLSKEYAGVTVIEDGDSVTVQGKPAAEKPFCVVAAGYTDAGKLCDSKVLQSTEIKGTAIKWQLKGKTVKTFILAGSGYVPVG